MDELAITARDEAEALIATIHARLDENEGLRTERTWPRQSV